MDITLTVKQHILQEIDQVFIYSTFLNIPESEIHNCISIRNYKTNNPLRTDIRPSLSFRYYNDKLIAKDFADYKYRGDVFEIVGLVLNLNHNNSNDFVTICKTIIDNCSDTSDKRTYVNKQYNSKQLRKRELTNIEIEPMNHTEKSINFYRQYGITRASILSNITVVKRYTINGYINDYVHTLADPCYAYVVNTNRIKLYFPFRTKQEGRFITNNTCPIENITTINKSRYKILIKAQKDKFVLEQLLKDLDIPPCECQVLSIASETAKLPDDIVSILWKYTSNMIFTMLDLDNTGLASAIEYEKNYKMKPLFLSNGYTSKDPSDFVKDQGYLFVLNKFKLMYKNEMLCY